MPPVLPPGYAPALYGSVLSKIGILGGKCTEQGVNCMCTIVNLSLSCPTNTVSKGLLYNKYVVSKGVITI